MHPLRRGLVPALLLLTAVGCGEGEGDRALVPGTVDRPPFSGAEALALVETQVGFGPRVPGTVGHAAQLEWMEGWLRERADEVSIDRFTHTHGETGEEIPLANLRARFRPELKDRILLLAHWDTRPTADQEATDSARARPIPGANDGGSGTAVLLQVADAFSRQAPPIGVDLLFVDGEDYGPTVDDMLLGARRYARTVPTDDRPRYAVLLDLVGDASPNFPIEGYSAQFAGEVAERIWGLAAAMGHGSSFPRTIGQRLMDDHVPLNQVGIPTVDIIDFDYGPGNAYWHTLEDDVDKVDARSLDMVGDLVLELVYLGG